MSAERLQSLQYLRHSTVPLADDLTHTLYAIDSPEAIARARELKPERYAALAAYIESVLDLMHDERSNHPPTGFMSVDEPDPWQNIRLSTLRTANHALDQLQGSELYWQTQHYNTLLGNLDSGRYVNLTLQMLAGFDTAASTMLTTLRNIPHILRAHDVRSDTVATARRSIGVPWKLAMISVNQLIAAQEALHDKTEHTGWSDVNCVLRPELFKVTTHNNSDVSITFDGLFDELVPAGYTPSAYHVPRLDEPTTIANLPAKEPTIGCPITLLSQRLATFWDWYIDVIQAQDLWHQY